MCKYLELKKENQKKFNDFSKKYIYWIFAFSEKEFNDKLLELNLSKDDIVSIGAGGFIKKSDKEKYLSLHLNSMENIIDIIKDDDEELKKAFIYELGNHEYCVTYDLDDTLDALGLTRKQLQEDPRMALIMNKACEEYLSTINYYWKEAIYRIIKHFKNWINKNIWHS